MFLLISFFTSLPAAEKENFNFSTLTNEDGLSYNSITCILQDSKGFLWLGTYNGLNKYDGYNFKVFTPNNSDPNSIIGQTILSIFEDKNGFIWIGTNKGLSKYDPALDKFTNYPYDKNNPKSISYAIVFSINEDSKGNIWIGTLYGLDKYNPGTNDFTKIKNIAGGNKNKGFEAVTCISEDHLGNIWLGTKHGITCLKSNGSTEYIPLPDNNITIHMNSEVSSIVEDHQNNLWIGTRLRGVFKYNPATGSFINYTRENKDGYIAGNSIRCILRDSYNTIWVGTRSGLSKYNFVSDNFTNFYNDPEKPLSISNNNIMSMIEDKTGVMWIGTMDGLNRFYRVENPFDYIPVDEDPGNRIHSVIKDYHNNIWIGSRKGIFKISTGSEKVVPFKHDVKLLNKFVFQLKAEKDGTILAGSSVGGLCRIYPESGNVHFYNNNNKPDNRNVVCFSSDKDGNIWTGTWQGIQKFDTRKETFSKIPEIKSYTVWSILCDSKGTVWVTTSGNGLYNLDPRTKKTVYFSSDSTAKIKILSNRVLSLLESHDGLIWIGTADGLCSYNRKTGKINSYRMSEGLIFDIINSLIEDNDGNIWIGTDKGLSKFNRKTNVFRNYGKRDGIPDISFSPNAAYKDENGILYFGTLHGILRFNPKKISNKGLEAPVVFTDLLLNGQSINQFGKGEAYMEKFFPLSDQISFPYSNGIVTVYFALMDYVNTKNNRFSYKLAGLDADWNNIGSRNSATYTNLPPGKYNLLVKAYNENGWVGKTASLKIEIIPSFYQTLGFKVFLSVLFILFIVLVINFRTRTIKKQNLLLEQKVNEHTQYLDRIITDLSQEITERKKAEAKVKASLDEKEILLKEIHHRVKNNLQIISSLLYLQSTKAKDKETLSLFEDSQNRIKSMALIHEKLYQSKDFAGINFNEYVNGLIGFLNKSLKSNVNIKTHISIDNINLDLDTAISCGLIINELVTNSFKYAFPPDFVNVNGAEDYYVKISIVNNFEGSYILTVCDNGIGFPPDMDIKKADTLGLKLVNSMVKQLDGSIDINSDKGTIFKISFS